MIAAAGRPRPTQSPTTMPMRCRRSAARHTNRPRSPTAERRVRSARRSLAAAAPVGSIARCKVSDVSRALSNWRTCCMARLRWPMSTVTRSRSSALTQRGTPKLQPQREVSGAGEHRDQSLCLARSVGPLDRLGGQRQLVTRVLKCLAQPRIQCAPSRFGRFARRLDGRFAVAGRATMTATTRWTSTAVRHSSRVIDKHLGHALGHRHSRGQAQDRAFPGRKCPFRGDVANRSDVDVSVVCRSPLTALMLTVTQARWPSRCRTGVSYSALPWLRTRDC